MNAFVHPTRHDLGAFLGEFVDQPHPRVGHALDQDAGVLPFEEGRGQHREEVGEPLGGAGRWLVGDLADPDAVRALAGQIRQDTDQLHALVHTAATLTPDRQENRAGHELMFATNLLGRFLLTHELLPLLERRLPRGSWS